MNNRGRSSRLSDKKKFFSRFSPLIVSSVLKKIKKKRYQGTGINIMAIIAKNLVLFNLNYPSLCFF